MTKYKHYLVVCEIGASVRKTMDLLVSENESSSSEVLSRSNKLRDGAEDSLNSSRSNRGEAYEKAVRQEEFQPPLSSDDESEQGDDVHDEDSNEDTEAKGAYTGGAKDIKNEMVKSKITTSASVVLTRLPPASSNMIKKITQETNQKSKYWYFFVQLMCYTNGHA